MDILDRLDRAGENAKRIVGCLAFTVAFAVLAGFVFWGTWSLDFVPVMPDHPTSHAADHLSRFLDQWLANGKLIPGDLIEFLGTPYFWQELKYALSLYFAALGLAYFCRGRGLPRVASYGAGLLLAFSGYWMTLFSAGHYGWFQWMTYGVFAFGLVDRAVERGRLHHWLLLGTVVAWAGFNQQDMWLLFSVFTAAYFAFRCRVARQLPWKGALIALAAFALVGLPNFRTVLGETLKGREEQLKESAGASASEGKGAGADKRWEFVTNWSMPPEDTAEFVVPGVHGDTSCPFVLSIARQLGKSVTPYVGRLGRPMKAPSGNYRQHSLYLGPVFCLLALAGVVSAFRKAPGRRDIVFFAVAAVVFYLFSLGRFFAPAYRIIYALPFGDMIRCPVKWHHLTEFCLAVLAGHGIAWGMSLVGRLGRIGRYAPIVLALVAFAGAAELARVDHRYCAPVDMREARRTNSFASLTFLQKQQFVQDPQIAEMVRRRLVVSVANYFGNPDVYLVSVLQPFTPAKPSPASVPAILLGIVSLAASLGVAIYSTKAVCLRRTVDLQGQES